MTEREYEGMWELDENEEDSYDGTWEMTEAEKWDKKYVNNLPNAAFAIILPGGKNDDTGRTVPRSRRKLPHHNKLCKSATENNSVDLPHLRNALARVSQSGTSLTSQQRAKARVHLEQHASVLLKTHKKND
jgi:hypothetical protein